MLVVYFISYLKKVITYELFYLITTTPNNKIVIILNKKQNCNYT